MRKNQIQKAFKGDIFLYDFGYNEGSLYRGIRPILCISNIRGSQMIYSPVTTNVSEKKSPVGVCLVQEENKFLNKESMVRLDQMFTMEKDSKKLKLLGKLQESDLGKVDNSIVYSLSSMILNSRCKLRGTILQYKSNSEESYGQDCYGLVLQNDMGNFYSRYYILVKVTVRTPESNLDLTNILFDDSYVYHPSYVYTVLKSDITAILGTLSVISSVRITDAVLNVMSIKPVSLGISENTAPQIKDLTKIDSFYNEVPHGINK